MPFELLCELTQHFVSTDDLQSVCRFADTATAEIIDRFRCGGGGGFQRTEVPNGGVGVADAPPPPPHVWGGESGAARGEGATTGVGEQGRGQVGGGVELWEV